MYLWTGAVMASASVILYRCITIANAMDANSNHGIRCATCVISLIALGEVLAPLAGRVPDAPEGWLVIAMGIYFWSDKRRPVFRRTQDREGVQA